MVMESSRAKDSGGGGGKAMVMESLRCNGPSSLDSSVVSMLAREERGKGIETGASSRGTLCLLGPVALRCSLTGASFSS